MGNTFLSVSGFCLFVFRWKLFIHFQVESLTRAGHHFRQKSYSSSYFNSKALSDLFFFSAASLGKKAAKVGLMCVRSVMTHTYHIAWLDLKSILSNNMLFIQCCLASLAEHKKRIFKSKDFRRNCWHDGGWKIIGLNRKMCLDLRRLPHSYPPPHAYTPPLPPLICTPSPKRASTPSPNISDGNSLFFFSSSSLFSLICSFSTMYHYEWSPSLHFFRARYSPLSDTAVGARTLPTVIDEPLTHIKCPQWSSTPEYALPVPT